jgi:hypothetical protein
MVDNNQDEISAFRQELQEDFKGVAEALQRGLEKVATEIQGMKKDLLESATGKDQISMAVADKVFDSYKFMIKVLSGLLVSVFVWVTGIQPMLPSSNRAPMVQNEKN